MNLIERIKSTYSFYRSIPTNTRKLLQEEEIHGAKIANRFRYFVGLAFLLFAFADLSITTSFFGLLTNFGVIFLFFSNTILHSKILKTGNSSWKLRYEYVSIFIDNTLIAVTIWNWYLLEGNGNPNYIVKNPLFFFFLIPISLTLIQFRITLTLNTLFYFLFYYYSFFIYSRIHGGLIGSSWYNYILGEEILFADAFITRPVLFTLLTISICYGIYRSYIMLIRIGKVEAQKSSLARYFSPDLVEEITSLPDSIQTGRRQKVTVLFSDIRNFTHFSESMDTKFLSDFLTEYRRRMTRAVFKHSGTLDKFIGDAVMATFGTPIPSEIEGLDSGNAVLSAKQMFLELQEFNRERQEKGESEIRIGIGIHSGDVFAGNIGSEERMEYTVIGDTVNTASRIESACKSLNEVFLISHDVWVDIGKPNEFVKTPMVNLAGKEKAIELYAWRPQ